VASLLIGLTLSGTSGSGYFDYLWTGTFGNAVGIGSLATLTFPLLLLGLAAAIPYRLGLWNIGGDGQLLVGAWAAAGVGFLFPNLAGGLLVPLMFVSAMVGGAVWILFPALARVYLGVNEIITTLLLNFVASYWVLYWAAGPWREPLSAGGVQSRMIPLQAQLPLITVGGAGIPVGLMIGLGIAGVSWFVFRQTTLGYEMSLLGASSRTAEYIGLPTKRMLVVAMLVGGALAGLAGVTEMMCVVDRYGPALTNNTGYVGVIIAVLAAGSELGVVVIAILFACITISGNILQVAGASSDLIFAMYGLTLVFAALGQAFAHVKLVRRRPGRPTTGRPEMTQVGEEAR
jgi:simple sugar transport system permease protein